MSFQFYALSSPLRPEHPVQPNLTPNREAYIASLELRYNGTKPIT